MKSSLIAFVLAATALVPGVGWAAGASGGVTQAPQEMSSMRPVNPGEPRAGWSFHDFEMIPVQSGGRVEPLDTLARETELFVTGSRSWEGWKPVDLLLSWISAPKAWANRQFIKISNNDVKRQLGLDENRARFSPNELVNDSYLAQYAETAQRNGSMQNPASVTEHQKPSARDQELKRVMERVSLYRSIVTGEGWPVIPGTNPHSAWGNLAGMDQPGELIRHDFARTVLAYRANDRGGFEQGAKTTRASVENAMPGFDASQARLLKAEEIYNRLTPFHWAWILYLLAAITFVIAIFSSKAGAKVLRKIALTLCYSGMFIHGAGFLLRCYVAGRPPVTNMYESVIWVSFGVLIFASIIYYKQRQPVVLATACALAALAVIAADAAPSILDPGIHPLVPVLRSNYWLTIHVLTITLSYGAFMLSLGFANVTLFQFLRGGSGTSARVLNMNNLTYRAQQFGVVLLAAGTILGGVWADYSWGRFWGWDPKEVWALVALLTYIVILHARFTGWVGQFSYAAWTVVAFLSVLMAWYGVNFVLGKGLHSYGFSTGGQSTILTFIGIQLAYVLYATFVRYRRGGLLPRQRGA